MDLSPELRFALTIARVAGLRARVGAGERALGHLGPTKVLERGYSITSLEGSTTPLRDASRVQSGQTLLTRLARGELRSLVRNATIDPTFETRKPGLQPSLFDGIESSGAEPGEQGAEDD